MSLLSPKLSSSSYSTSSADNILKCESKNSSKSSSSSSSQPVTHSYNLRSRPTQISSSSSTRSTSSSISAVLRQYAQPHSSTSENHPSSLSDIPISLRPSSGIENSFAVHSFSRYTHLSGDQKSVSSLSAINLTELPYHTLEENSKPPTPDLYDSPLRLDNQIFIHPEQNLSYHILPVDRKK